MAAMIAIRKITAPIRSCNNRPVCPTRCMTFGDLDDPQSDVSKLRAAKKTYKLKDVGNHPGVDYAMDKCAWKGDE